MHYIFTQCIAVHCIMIVMSNVTRLSDNCNLFDALKWQYRLITCRHFIVQPSRFQSRVQSHGTWHQAPFLDNPLRLAAAGGYPAARHVPHPRPWSSQLSLVCVTTALSIDIHDLFSGLYSLRYSDRHLTLIWCLDYIIHRMAESPRSLDYYVPPPHLTMLGTGAGFYLATSAVVLTGLLTWCRKYWDNRSHPPLPPGPPFLPILGSVLSLDDPFRPWLTFTAWKSTYGAYNFGGNCS